jgi:predicted metal-dependent hydrolase
MSQRAYTTRVSPKAKHPRIKLSAREGLTVVIPRGFDEERIPELLERKRDWIRKTQERLDEQRKFFVPEPPGKPPERAVLRLIGEEWYIDYRMTDSEKVTAVERSASRLLVYGDIDNTQATKNALLRWLNRKTHEHVVPWLWRLSLEEDFQINGVMVKSQRTRWASCSASRTISLNLRLMFLPERLVRYVLIHELVHSKEMNHSKRYWMLLRAYEPSFEQYDAELREAWRLVPAWVS